jgi:hypothetical protein
VSSKSPITQAALVEARQVVHVLRGFFGDDVDHVVHRDDAEHATLGIGDGEGQQVVVGYEAGRFLLVGIGADRDRTRDHELLHGP